MNYYNEFDKIAAAWLRELIAAKRIPGGEVDERSVVDVDARDIDGFTQCHFFAGIGGWSRALDLAGWPADRPVWTGSCPCQPFSVAGKQAGGADDRHLWPHWFRLIRECRPASVFGEQVASAIGHGWLDLVSTDLESEGYACGAVVLGAHSVGAPHIRQRLYFVAHRLADDHDDGREVVGAQRIHDQGQSGHYAARRGEVGRVVNSVGEGLERHPRDGDPSDEPGRFLALANGPVATASGAGRMGDSEFIGAGRNAGASPRTQGRIGLRAVGHDVGPSGPDDGPDAPGGFWRAPDWVWCRDEKWRPVEPGTFPLVDGLSKGVVRSRDPGAPINANATSEARVMRLRGYGNAIAPQVAAEFILSIT